MVWGREEALDVERASQEEQNGANFSFIAPSVQIHRSFFHCFTEQKKEQHVAGT